MSVLETECQEKLQRERMIATTLRFRLAHERNKLADLVRAHGALLRSQRQAAEQAVIGSVIVSGVPVAGKKLRVVKHLKSKKKVKKRVKKQTQNKT